MFGYVVPEKNELKVRELVRYRAYYCGLCRSIGRRYGEPARLFLNYDSVFAAILLSGIFRSGDFCTPSKCMYKPFKKEVPVMPANERINEAADLNVILAWHNLKDDAKDERSFKTAGGRLLLAGAYQKAKKEKPELDDIITSGISTLTRLETKNCDELDAPADAFGKVLRDCFKHLGREAGENLPAMAAMGYNLGKWIYLVDAWQDRKDDSQKGIYNVFNATGADRGRASFLIYYSLNEAIAAYELLRLASNREITDNIMLTGCMMKTNAVLEENQ